MAAETSFPTDDDLDAAAIAAYEACRALLRRRDGTESPASGALGPVARDNLRRAVRAARAGEARWDKPHSALFVAVARATLNALASGRPAAANDPLPAPIPA